jgi:hypothetical protein
MSGVFSRGSPVRNHGWLTPAAPGARRRFVGSITPTRDAQTHADRSGGRQPAVVGKPTAVPGKSNIVRPLANAQPGAANVSPPWLRNRACADAFVIALKIADSVCAARRCIRVYGYHGGLTPPALVLRCGCLPTENDFSDTPPHVDSGAAGVSPPWVAKHTGNGRRFLARVAGQEPRLAHASRSWCTASVRRQHNAHPRCTNARRQERRALARRGSNAIAHVRMRS